MGSPCGWVAKNPPLGWEDPLEKEMATHSSILAWRIPWTEEPGRLQSMESQRVRYDLPTEYACVQFSHSVVKQSNFSDLHKMQTLPSLMAFYTDTEVMRHEEEEKEEKNEETISELKEWN